MPSRTVDTLRTRGASTDIPAKSTSRSRNPRPVRTSANQVDIPDEGESTSLREQICRLFGEAQRTTATQRKLIVQLRKVQEACCNEPSDTKKRKPTENFGEEELNAEISRCLLRVLPVKKTEPAGDRIVKFLGLFLKHAGDKDHQATQDTHANVDEKSVPSTPSTRLATHIFSTLIPLLQAKDKIVRYRATQIISHLLNSLDSVDDELYPLVRSGLLKRLKDRETQVRVQAVSGLARLADYGNEDDEDSDGGDCGKGILERLLTVLVNDPAAEVRRSLLHNLPPVPSILPYLLERARDVDTATRRILYTRLLPACGDFRHLSLAHRERLLRWGLRDRDETVRKAAARLFYEHWIEDCAGAPEGVQADSAAARQCSKPSIDALLELLERIDVTCSGAEDRVAHEAMHEFWVGRPDYRECINFDDAFWDDLTPERAFLARSFNDFCQESGDDRLNDKMPEVSAYGYLIKKHLTALVECIHKAPQGDDEDMAGQEFCVEQLLHIARKLDYTDEMGRRHMSSVMRQALAIPDLPEECTKLVVETLRAICSDDSAGEREFCDNVLEAIADVHDTIMGDDGGEKQDNDSESFHSAHSDVDEIARDSTRERLKKKHPGITDEELRAAEEKQAVWEIMVHMKCLHIAQCMLQNVKGKLESSSALVTMLHNLVIPAVESQDAPVRERGVICLGLCCLLSKNIADENLAFFLYCFEKGHATLRTIVLEVVTDILITHPSLLASPPDGEGSESKAVLALLKSTRKIFQKAIKSEHPDVATTGAVGASKLMLLGILRDPDLLKALTTAYFTPETRNNPGLRQALTYFLPVYCHSRNENAERMASIAVSVLHVLRDAREELDADEGTDMVGISDAGSQIIDWTDARRSVGAHQMVGRLVGGEVAQDGLGDAHLLLAEDLLGKCLSMGATRDEKKSYASMVGKLHVHPTCSPEKIKTVGVLVERALDSKFAQADRAVQKAFLKLFESLPESASSSAKAENSDAVAPGVKGVDQVDVESGMTIGGKNGGDDGDDDDRDSALESDAASAADDDTRPETRPVAGGVDEMSAAEEESEKEIDGDKGNDHDRQDRGDDDTKEEEEEEEITTVISTEKPAALGLEDLGQMQPQDETMRDIDAEGTMIPIGVEMERDVVDGYGNSDDIDAVGNVEMDRGEDQGITLARASSPTPILSLTPPPPPLPQRRKVGRPKKAAIPEPSAKGRQTDETEEVAKPKKRGRPEGSSRRAVVAAAEQEMEPAKRRRNTETEERAEEGVSRRSRGRPRLAAPKTFVDALLESDDE